MGLLDMYDNTLYSVPVKQQEQKTEQSDITKPAESFSQFYNKMYPRTGSSLRENNVIIDYKDYNPFFGPLQQYTDTDFKYYNLRSSMPVQTNVADIQTPTPGNLQQVTPKISKRDLYNQNQGGGISTQEAYRRQKLLREKGFNIAYDGYYGDASRKAWAEYQASLTPKMETTSLAVAPSVTKPVTTPKPTDPNSPEANRQRFLDQQATKISTAQMPPQLANIDIMGAIKAEEARKKAELEALMQKQGASSKLLNTDPHNIKGGYVVPKEEPLDYSKLQTHTTDTNPFGFITADHLKDASKFYQKGGEVKEKETPTSFYSSGYFIDENGNPVTQETEMVKGNYNGKQYNIQRNIINTNGKSDTIMYNNNKRIPLENPDSAALYNEVFRDLLMRAQPVGEFKKGGSLKKCSCGCKTLLKRGKGGKVMESKNCK